MSETRIHQPEAQTGADSGLVWTAQLFLLSLLIPFHIPVGSLLLMPHRVVILVFFIPFFIRLFATGKAGPVILADWLLFLSAVWAGIALAANHPLGTVIEPFGIHMIEFFGAYLLARVAIRSSADFRRMVWTLFGLIAFLVPFAAIESITKRPILIELLPGNSIRPVNIGARFGLRRAQTVFAHPILFGVFVSTGFGLFWYGLRPSALRFVGPPLAAIGTVFSFSVGALISVVVQSVFIGWETVMRSLRTRWRLFLAGAIVGYILLDLAASRTPFHLLVHYASFSTGSAYNRIHIWNFGMDNVWANPVFGLGLNEWVRPGWMSGSIDNFWLLLAMRYGLPTILMVLLALVQILQRVARAALDEPADKSVRAAYLVAFGGLFIAGGTVHYWHAMMAFVLFIYGSGLWAATGEGKQHQEPAAPQPSPEQLHSRYTRQPAPGQPIAGGRLRPVAQAQRSRKTAR